MWRALLPRESRFFDLFERHAELAVQAAATLAELLSQQNSLPAVARAKRVKEIEHEADVLTHECVELLHKTFVTPIDRDAIHRLITRMDDVVDNIESAAERVALYELAAGTPEARELARVLVSATQEIVHAIKGLRDLKHASGMLVNCVNINRLENEGDTILRLGVARLFKEGPDPLWVMKWKEIYEYLENATDRCEDVANIIEGIVLENE